MSSDDFTLAAARSLGARVAREAIWFDARCTWPTLQISPGIPGRVATIACGPDVYGGTAGIGVVFAQLYSRTKDPAFARTAVGALEHALHRAMSAPPTLAFYAGTIGVAWAACVVGSYCEAPSLLDRAYALVPASPPGKLGTAETDIISGAAGAIPALRTLDHFGCPSARRLALGLGELLVRSAARGTRGLSWPTVVGQEQNLTGFAHGASGIAFALAELFAWTEEEACALYARAAMDYERAFFDPIRQNWRDLRDLPGRPARQRGTFGGAWCHGAPGIALARMHCAHVLRDERARQEALQALSTTAEVLFAGEVDSTADWSLCHGRAGLCDVLLVGHEYGFDVPDSAVRAMTTCAAIEIERAGREWGSGTGTGDPVPGALLGLTGVAHLLLRTSPEPPPSLLTSGLLSRRLAHSALP